MELKFRKGYKLLSVLMEVCKLGVLKWLEALRSTKTPRTKGKDGIREKGTEKNKLNSIPVPICSVFTWILLDILIHFLKSCVLLKQSCNEFL